MHLPRLTALFCLLPAAAGAQRADTLALLADIRVQVSRTPTPLRLLAAGVTVIDSALLHRSGLPPGVDEALAYVPGVLAANRWNYSLDQRLSIRGAGARANFGWRGVKVLVDDVPQTLPDGQSQTNHLDLARVSRVEVIRGAASAEHGNASGGVLAFSTARPGSGPTLTWAASGGSGHTRQTRLQANAREGTLGATLALSAFHTDGLRQNAGATQRRVTGAVAWAPTGYSDLTLRLDAADDPRADNPGALTRTELERNPDSAAATNLRRHAGKAVQQTQLALTWRHTTDRRETTLTTWHLWRDLENPLAAPSELSTRPQDGTWVGIDRRVMGVRGTTTWRPGTVAITAGADLQRMRDERVNRLSIDGLPTGAAYLDRQEQVTEAGAFLRGTLPLRPALSLTVGGRWDRTRFAVIDRIQTSASSGDRIMQSPSWSVALGWTPSSSTTLWTTAATSFETPTTTELGNLSPNSAPTTPLGPQHTVMVEAGIRSRRQAIQWEAAIWRSRTRDAIVPVEEIGGRSFFRNAGRTSATGGEVAAHWLATSRLTLHATASVMHARFDDYQRTSSQRLDGNRLPGLPRGSGRVGLTGALGRGLALDVDQVFRSSMYADDTNQLQAEGLGAGVTTLRLAWRGAQRGAAVGGYLMVGNLFDRRHVAAVTVNGAGGRVYEPAPGRVLTVGFSVSR